MIFNENGRICSNKTITINESIIEIPNILFEASRYEDIIEELKDEIRQCDDKYVDKLNNLEKIKFLSKKSNIIITIAGTLLVSFSPIPFASNPQTVIELGICTLIFAALLGIGIKLLDIIIKDAEARDKKNKEIISTVKEIIAFLETQYRNKKLPQKVRDNAYMKLNKLKSKVEELADIEREANANARNAALVNAILV